MAEMNRSYGQTDPGLDPFFRPSGARRTKPRIGLSRSGGAEERVKEIGDRAQEHASQFAERGRERAAEQLRSLAEAVRETGSQLENKGSPFGGYVGKAAGQIERLSEIAVSKNPRDLVDSVERFARRDRALFLGGAMTLGLMAARFLRSSSRPRGGRRGRRFDEATTGYAVGDVGYRYQREPLEREPF